MNTTGSAATPYGQLSTVPFNAVRVARAGLSKVLEPRDHLGQLILAALGPVSAWEVISGDRGVRGQEHQALEAAVRNHGGLSDLAALAKRSSATHGAATQGGGSQAAQRWAARAAACNPAQELEHAARCGIWQCIPEDPDWPAALGDLGLFQPVCLWGRGERARLEDLGPLAVSVVGSRDCSSYGRSVTYDLAGGLAARGWTVMSGGAYGVDEAAHSAALSAGTSPVPTVAVMAGGVDRFYPRGNQTLLERVMERGLVISEAAPGTMPARFRFLDRNRLIAALGSATLVTEARWRSGAQSTAHHANDLSRPVAAVPGSVQSATSAGCHRLIREGSASLVTDLEDFLALVGPLHSGRDPQPPDGDAQLGIFDDLSEIDRQLADALPVTTPATVDSLATVAGLPLPTVLGGLKRLERAGLAVDHGGHWVRPRKR